MRRAGRIPTGIDRVEAAYLAHLLESDIPLFGLIRSAFGYLLLDRAGLLSLQDRMTMKVPWGATDLLSRLPRKLDDIQRRAESDARRLAIVRTSPQKLAARLRGHLPVGMAYINVGHSNLTARVLNAVRAVPGARVSVLVHDLIPLDFPAFQRPGSVAPFESKMRRVALDADLVIYNSADTAMRAERRFAAWGRVPEGVVSHLGVSVPDPSGPVPQQPYFVTVGTIEPRKNHAFLIDLWQELGPDAPKLLICGQRGWSNESVFERLDNVPPGGPIQEVSDLSDVQIATLVAGASGALYPSLAEGFGLPVVEALALGTPVLCNTVSTFKEIAGEKAVYADVNDRYLWINIIKKWAENTPGAEKAKFDPPNWRDHFKTVLRLT